MSVDSNLDTFSLERIRCYNCGEKGHKMIKCAAPTRCYNCNLTGHKSMNCPEEKSLFRCYNCREEGHKSANCPRKENLLAVSK